MSSRSLMRTMTAWIVLASQRNAERRKSMLSRVASMQMQECEDSQFRIRSLLRSRLRHRAESIAIPEQGNSMTSSFSISPERDLSHFCTLVWRSTYQAQIQITRCLTSPCFQSEGARLYVSSRRARIHVLCLQKVLHVRSLPFPIPSNRKSLSIAYL